MRRRARRSCRARRPARARRAAASARATSYRATSTLTVTRDFGGATLHEGTSSRHASPEGETVMRLLQRNFDVKTRYGGGFVQEIDGVGGRARERPAGRLVLLRQRDRVAPSARPSAQASRRATASGGTTTTGARRCASRRSSARSRSRSVGRERQAVPGPARLRRTTRERSCDEVETAARGRGRDGGVARRRSSSRPARRCCACSSARWADVRARPGRARGSSAGPRRRACSRGRPSDGDAIALLDARRQAGAHAAAPASGLVAATQRRGDQAADLGRHRHRRRRRRGRGGGARRGPARRTTSRSRSTAGSDVPLPVGRRAGRRRDLPAALSPLHAARAGVGALWCVALAARRAVVRAPADPASRCWRGARWRRGRRAGVGRAVARSLAVGAAVRARDRGGQRARDARRADGRVPRLGELPRLGPARRHARGARLRRRARRCGR